MKIIPLILCRGGSKNIPRKNIKLLNGKPLLSYILDEALKVFPKVYISTEDEEIAKIATQYGATIIARPSILAQDESKSITGVKHALEELRAFEGQIDYIMLLNACCPLTKAKHIQEVVNIVLKTKCDSITSLVEDSSSHPSKTCYLIENKIYPTDTGYSFETGERQRLTKIYKRNTAIYLSSVKTIKKNTFFGKNTKGYVMSQEDSLDINSPYDFLMAELYMKYLNGQQSNL